MNGISANHRTFLNRIQPEYLTWFSGPGQVDSRTGLCWGGGDDSMTTITDFIG
jgi:hypothetical protein